MIGLCGVTEQRLIMFSFKSSELQYNKKTVFNGCKIKVLLSAVT